MNVGKYIKSAIRKASRESVCSSEAYPESVFDGNSGASSYLKRRKKKQPLTRYEEIKTKILQE